MPRKAKWTHVTIKEPEELLLHKGHSIEIIEYGDGADRKGRAVAIECNDCQTVLLDWERNIP